jgi:hypothetical protein
MADADPNVRYLRLGSLALLGGAGGVLLLWLLFFWVGASRPLGGLDDVHGLLTRLTTLVPAVLIALAHVAVARQLAAAARERAAGRLPTP